MSDIYTMMQIFGAIVVVFSFIVGSKWGFWNRKLHSLSVTSFYVGLGVSAVGQIGAWYATNPL